MKKISKLRKVVFGGLLSTTIEDNNIITIESGIYNVDRTLGEYGGYRIKLND